MSPATARSCRTLRTQCTRCHCASRHCASVTSRQPGKRRQSAPGRALPPGAEIIALDGAFVAPGFVDAHVHATATGLHLTGLDLTGVRGATELLAAIRDAVRPGEVLIAHGWDESTWTDPR